MKILQKIGIDNFTLALVGAALLATFLPVHDVWAEQFAYATSAAVAALFFLHGVNLSREAMVAGLAHWRLHLVVLFSTFGLFPLLGLLAQLLPSTLLSPSLAAGILFLCCLPSTVQSSIAFTSIAHGNVAAAVCSASLSNLLGVFITPLMVSLLIKANGAVSLDSVGSIVLQILLPFAVGQACHGKLSGWTRRHKRVLGRVDRGSILMVVYGAFSAAVVDGLWRQMPLQSLAVMVLLDILLLGLVLWATAQFGALAFFNLPDRIAVIFCGSKKSLASGMPMANILFPPQMVGAVVLPLMLFHQIQLVACAVLARRFAVSTAAQVESGLKTAPLPPG